MADQYEKWILGAVLGGSAIGAGLYLSKRWRFQKDLEESLQGHSLQLVHTDFGRGPEGEAIWHVTVTHPRLGMHALRASFPASADPYASETREELSRRIIAWSAGQLV